MTGSILPSAARAVKSMQKSSSAPLSAFIVHQNDISLTDLGLMMRDL
jgi:hypothetical protein